MNSQNSYYPITLLALFESRKGLSSAIGDYYGYDERYSHRPAGKTDKSHYDALSHKDQLANKVNQTLRDFRSGLNAAKDYSDVDFHRYTGVFHKDIDTSNPSHLQLLADVANHAAKDIHPYFYHHKKQFVTAAYKLGASGGWRNHDSGEIFYLHNPDVGTSSYHDPFEEIRIPTKIRWNKKWDRIPRQHLAPEILNSYLRKGKLSRMVTALTSGEAGPSPRRRARRYIGLLGKAKYSRRYHKSPMARVSRTLQAIRKAS